MHHVSGPVGRTGGPKTKSFQGEKFETGGFNIFQGKITAKRFFGSVGRTDGLKKSF